MAKRKIPVKRFESSSAFQDFIDTERDWMYTRIIEAITDAHKNFKDKAVIFEAKIEETMSSISMESERCEWENSLSLAIKWYVSTEEYERCSEIQKLIELIRTPLISNL